MTAAAEFDLRTANPHALATILEASETQRIIACRDIFDISGTKLWAGDQPVSASLQRKLMDRQLKNPLETCLMAEDGVTAAKLAVASAQKSADGSPLAQLIGQHAPRLALEAGQLPLHPVAQLLLSTAASARPAAYDHALTAMLIAGVLMIDNGGSVAEVRLAMLGGLLHDIGELYIAPEHGEADADRSMDIVAYRQLVAHPHVGQLLLSQLTQYPAALSRAIAEHHEHLDGSGYPHALKRDAISPLGRLLAVAETTANVLRSDHPQLARASVALRVVPGEYDLAWTKGLALAAAAQPRLQTATSTEEVQARLSRLNAALESTQSATRDLLAGEPSADLKRALTLTAHLLGRLRTGWYASGLWSAEAIADQDAAEVDAVEDELNARLRGIVRMAQLAAGELPGPEQAPFSQLCEDISAWAS